MMRKISTTAPKPQDITSRNESEKTFVWRRAMVVRLPGDASISEILNVGHTRVVAVDLPHVDENRLEIARGAL